MIRWRNEKLLSFDPTAVSAFERSMVLALAFVRDIVRIEPSITACDACCGMRHNLGSCHFVTHAWNFQTGEWRRMYFAADLIDAIAGASRSLPARWGGTD